MDIYQLDYILHELAIVAIIRLVASNRPWPGFQPSPGDSQALGAW